MKQAETKKNNIIEKLEQGTYTYQQLCELFGWAYYRNGVTGIKGKQLLELQRHCLFEEVGNTTDKRYHILEVYDKPTTDTVFYEPNSNDIYANHPQVLIDSQLLNHGTMIIYKIQYGNMIYIGSTKSPRKRISNHFKGHANEHTYSMLKRGGTFEVLEVITTSEEDLRAREIEYIQEYKLCGAYIVINNQHAK